MINALKYRLFLCLSTKEELCEIQFTKIDFTNSFRDFNTLSFTVPYYDEGWELNKDERFDLVKGLYFVRLMIYDAAEAVYDEYFVITEPNLSYDGLAHKTVMCYSKEYLAFNKRRLREYTEEALLYDAANPLDETAGLINYILNHVLYGSWSVGSINVDLGAITRSWNYSSSTLTEVFKDIENQLNCFIKFNNIDNTINIYALDELGVNLDLVISDHNYIKKISMDDKVSELTTRINCYGENNLTISTYNITGKPYIDDFTWLVSNNLLSADLIAAIGVYDALKASYVASFDGYISDLEGYINDLNLAEAQLDALDADLSIIDDDLDMYKNQFPHNTTDYNNRYIDKTNKNIEITNKNLAIDAINVNITNTHTSITIINDALEYNINFTIAQLDELNNFIFEEEKSINTINSEALLYEYASSYILKKAVPNIETSLNLIDILSSSDYSEDWEKVINGCGDYVYLDCTDLGLDYQPLRIIQIKHNPLSNELSCILSNSDKRKKDLDYLTTDIWQKSKQASLNLEVNQYDYKEYVTEKNKIIRTDDSIDASETNIIAGNSVINKRGFLGNNLGGNGDLQLLGDKLILSLDGFETYNTLLSGNGLYLERVDRLARIVIDAQYGFQLDKNVGTFETPVWNNILYFDIDDEAYIFDGLLSATAIEAVAAEIDIVISQTIIVQNLYAGNGYIAELTVDELDTSKKVKNYLDNIQDDVEYQRLHVQYHEFITANFISMAAVQATYRDTGNLLYWIDETHEGITYDDTGFPVLTYTYEDTTKLQIYYKQLGEYNVPIIELGAGADVPGYPDRGKGYVFKDVQGLKIQYLTESGEEVFMRLGEDGIVFTEDPAVVIGDEPGEIKIKKKIVMYDGSTIENITITDAETLVGVLNFQMVDTDHGYLSTTLNVEGGVSDGILTIIIYRGNTIFRTYKKSIKANEFKIVDISIIIPTLTILDTDITVMATASNADINISNPTITLDTNMLAEWFDYIPDPTKPFDMLNLSIFDTIMNIDTSDMDAIFNFTDSVSSTLIVVTCVVETDMLNLSIFDTIMNIDTSDMDAIFNFTDSVTLTIF